MQNEHPLSQGENVIFYNCKYKVSQWLGNFQVSACLTNTSKKPLESSSQQGECQKAYRCSAGEDTKLLLLFIAFYSSYSWALLIDKSTCKNYMLKTFCSLYTESKYSDVILTPEFVMSTVFLSNGE